MGEVQRTLGRRVENGQLPVYLFDKCIFSKDDPLRLHYWKRRLRDVRDLLSQAALDKLKAKCPTLFNMGWFKVQFERMIEMKEKINVQEAI